MQIPDLWVPWKGWNFSQSWSGVRDQIPSLPQHQGRQAGALPCQSHCATSLPFLSPGPPGLPEVPQQHPGDGGPVGEWGRAEVCASQGLWRWVLRNREGEALPEITFCLCSLGVMVVSVLEPQVRWLLWDLLALLTSFWIPHVSPCVSAGPFARQVRAAGEHLHTAPAHQDLLPRQGETLCPLRTTVTRGCATPAKIAAATDGSFFLFQSIPSSPRASKCRMRCWKRLQGRM